MKTSEEYIPTRLWWSAQRRRYNIGLFFAGIIAFICYATVVFTFEKRIPDADITIFTTLFQSIGYLFMMAVANVFYCLGPITEKVIKPRNIMRFRKLTFGLGYWGSVSLPFLIPIWLLILVATQPAWWTGNQ